MQILSIDICSRFFLTIPLMFRVNEMLGTKGTRFLTGDTMCCFDCELMPKLQHIRVAGRSSTSV